MSFRLTTPPPVSSRPSASESSDCAADAGASGPERPTAPRACLPTLRWGSREAGQVSRYRVFTDEQWERIAPLLPSNEGKVGRPYGDHRTVVEAIAYRYRTGVPWRDLPREDHGPWQAVWTRHRKLAHGGSRA